MKRLYPQRIRDKFFLSRLLETYLMHLEASELQVSLRALAYNSNIPEAVFVRMRQLHKNPDDAASIVTNDYHILFSNIMFHYPTIKIWLQKDGTVFFEM
ncbi:MAG TPA: hypothetical protein PLO67_11130 [Saprospiraceae bacterium]|nr:hypothetical protein [Saprospiraceae bacterium]HPI09065.1 hypothetical protein [Saprospiraceae bacterium]